MREGLGESNPLLGQGPSSNQVGRESQEGREAVCWPQGVLCLGTSLPTCLPYLTEKRSEAPGGWLEAMQVGLRPQHGQSKAPLSPLEPICLWEEEPTVVSYSCPQEPQARPAGSMGQLSHVPGPWVLGGQGTETPVGYQGQG